MPGNCSWRRESRFEAYATGIDWGIIPLIVRDLEDMNPRPGGDVYLTPMNMTTSPSAGDDHNGKKKESGDADKTAS